MSQTTTSETTTHTVVCNPKTVTIAITGDCNLACAHCLVESGLDSSAPHVPTQSIFRILDDFAAIGGKGIRITGGEPLCHHGWLDILSHARSKGFQTVALQTNGMLFDSNLAAALRGIDFSGLSIQISMDGASAKTHDPVRGKGAFSGALNGIKRLTQAGLAARISIFFTEMAHNLEEYPALLELAAEMGIGPVVGGTLLYSGRAAHPSFVKPPSTAQYLKLVERYDEDEHFRMRYQKAGNVAALEWHIAPAIRSECCTFAENPYISPRGTLYPCLLCHCDDFSVADVFMKGLAAALAEGTPLWTELLQISRCRTETIAECQTCTARHLCGGGCMGRAWGSHGNLLSVDDRCEVRRNIYHRNKLAATPS
jgi:radical SAM protein with 4Fe4S-binding SPASM domain